jgi:hypothetical protein
MYPAGERRQVELQRERKGEMYSPLTGRGGREEYKAWEEEHPEEVTRRTMYGALPGAEEYEGWTPGEARASKAYNREKDEVNRTYDAAVDELLRAEPWNKAEVRELEDERQAELDVLRDRYFGAPPQPPPTDRGGEEAEEEAYRARSVWGAGPEEAGEIRREEVLAAVSGAMPHVDDFRDEETGEVDYEAYEVAKGEFFADVAGSMGGDERLAAIAEAQRGEERGERRGARGAEGWPGLGVRMDPGALVEGIGLEEVQEYWRRNDRPLEAVQRVWEDTVYGPAWEAYRAAVDGGMEKGEAYDQFIEGVGETSGRDLLEAVQEMYPDRWSARELGRVLADVTFPGVGEVSTLRKPEEEQELDRAQGAFWDFFNEELPPGRMASGARDYTLVQLVLDAETRGTATAEQYQQALEFMQGWKAENFDRDAWGTAEDWARARELNDEFQEIAEGVLPGIQDLLDEYYDLSTTERRAIKDEHPEIGEYYDLPDEFGERNEVWAQFYLSGGAGEQRSWGAGRSYTRRPYYRRSYGRRSYGRRRYGGGGEKFWGTKYPPKTYLKMPEAWEGYMRPEGFGQEFRPRREGTPWLVQARRGKGTTPWLKSKW